MRALQSLENNLNDTFAKKAPPLPPSSKKALVQYLPWINLLLGLLALYTVYALWHWAHLNAGLLSVPAAASGLPAASNNLDFGIWLGLATLTIEALLYIAAFPGTRDRKKAGWNLMFYALLVNIVYGFIMLFTSYGGFATLLSTLIGSGVGLYLLFQIRSSYGVRTVAKKAA
jgi:uncharacterized membrane protein HdeD (DUF308 family)